MRTLSTLPTNRRGALGLTRLSALLFAWGLACAARADLQPTLASPPASPSSLAEGQLVVVSTPPGAILLDGEEIGRGTASRRLLAGEHAVEVRWPSGQTATEVVRVMPGESRALRLHEPGPSAVSAVAAPPVQGRPRGDRSVDIAGLRQPVALRLELRLNGTAGPWSNDGYFLASTFSFRVGLAVPVWSFAGYWIAVRAVVGVEPGGGVLDSPESGLLSIFYFELPLAVGVEVGLGHRDRDGWRGLVLGLDYQPSLVIDYSAGDSEVVSNSAVVGRPLAFQFTLDIAQGRRQMGLSSRCAFRPRIAIAAAIPVPGVNPFVGTLGIGAAYY